MSNEHHVFRHFAVKKDFSDYDVEYLIHSVKEGAFHGADPAQVDALVLRCLEMLVPAVLNGRLHIQARREMRETYKDVMETLIQTLEMDRPDLALEHCRKVLQLMDKE